MVQPTELDMNGAGSSNPSNLYLLLDGLASTGLGFALSSMSRSFRERRSQLLAKEKATEAVEEKKWQDLNVVLHSIQSTLGNINERLIKVETSQKIMETLRKESNGD